MTRGRLGAGVGFLGVGWLLVGVALGTVLFSSRWDCGPGSNSSERVTFAAMVFSFVATTASLIVLIPATSGRGRAAAVGAGAATVAVLLGVLALAGHHVLNDCDFPAA